MSNKASAILVAEEKAKVGKLQDFGGEEVGGTAQEDEGDRSAEADGYRAAEGINEVHASE
jgi:2-iminoacetate synthase ThiH